MDIFTTLNFDRNAGGAVVGASGLSFPAVPIAGEWFWRIDLQSLFRRNDANTAWQQITTVASDGSAPVRLLTNEVFVISPRRQVLFSDEIELEDGAEIEFGEESVLIEV